MSFDSHQFLLKCTIYIKFTSILTRLFIPTKELNRNIISPVQSISPTLSLFLYISMSISISIKGRYITMCGDVRILLTFNPEISSFNHFLVQIITSSMVEFTTTSHTICLFCRDLPKRDLLFIKPCRHRV